MKQIDPKTILSNYEKEIEYYHKYLPMGFNLRQIWEMLYLEVDNWHNTKIIFIELSNCIE